MKSELKLKIAIFSVKCRPKWTISLKKALNVKFSRDVFLLEKTNGDSYIDCKFQLNSMQVFFKMAT